MNWEIYTLSWVECTAGGKPVYSTSTQPSAVWQSRGVGLWGLRGRLKWEGIHAYLWLIRVVVRQKPTQHCKAIILQLKKKTTVKMLPHANQNGHHQKIYKHNHWVWRKRILLHYRRECDLAQSLWRTVWRYLEKLKTELPYDPAIQVLGIYLEKTMVRMDTCTPKFTAVLFTIRKT